MSPDEMKMPPFNAEAEMGVIGSVLLDNDVWPDVGPVLSADSFFRDSHQALWRAIESLAGAGKPVDGISLVEELERRGELRAAGGDDAVAEILNSTPHAANARYYADIVDQKARLRGLIEASHETLRECYSNMVSAQDAAERAEVRFLGLGDGRTTKTTREAGEFAGEAMERLLRRHGGECSGVPSGFAAFDDLTDGFAPKSLVVIAGRPSMGKTALAVQIADHAASRQGIATLFVSLEMGGIELGERLLCSRSKVDGHKLRTGQNLGGRELTLLANAYADIRAGERLMIDDSAVSSVSQIAATARRLKARRGLGLVVVDYIGLVEPGPESGPRASRQEQVAAISKRLKAMAKDLDLPVIALSQLNRESESREDRRPRLSDLRESGAIEQDADMVLLVHRPEYYDPNDQPGLADLILAKNRNGPTGAVRLVFRRNIASFEDVPEGYAECVPPGVF